MDESMIYDKLNNDSKKLDYSYLWIAKTLESLMGYLGIGWDDLFKLLEDIHKDNDGNKRADGWRFSNYINQLNLMIDDVDKYKKEMELDINQIIGINHLNKLDLINMD